MNDRTWKVPLSETTLDEAEVNATLRVMRRKWLTMGMEVAALEEEFAAALHCRHAVAVTNGTVALHLAYEAAGLQPGDDFCIPALTFAATMHGGMYLGANPILIDCASPEDLTLSVEDLARKITPKTRLIVTMPYGGYAPDMQAICELAFQHDVPVVEDACHAPLGELDGRKLGTFGLAGTFSFYGNKNLTTGEGGMVVTDDDRVAKRLRLMRSHGMTQSTWERNRKESISDYDVRAIGYNYRMDEMRAAIGREQLGKLARATERRRQVAHQLRETLASAEQRGLIITFPRPRGTPAPHLFVVLLPPDVERSAFRAFLAQRGIQTSMHYPPLHRLQHVASRFAASDLPVVNSIADRLVTLPLSPTFTGEQLQAISDGVDQALATAGR